LFEWWNCFLTLLISTTRQQGTAEHEKNTRLCAVAAQGRAPSREHRKKTMTVASGAVNKLQSLLETVSNVLNAPLITRRRCATCIKNPPDTMANACTFTLMPNDGHHDCANDALRRFVDTPIDNIVAQLEAETQKIVWWHDTVARDEFVRTWCSVRTIVLLDKRPTTGDCLESSDAPQQRASSTNGLTLPPSVAAQLVQLQTTIRDQLERLDAVLSMLSLAEMTPAATAVSPKISPKPLVKRASPESTRSKRTRPNASLIIRIKDGRIVPPSPAPRKKRRSRKAQLPLRYRQTAALPTQ